MSRLKSSEMVIYEYDTSNRSRIHTLGSGWSKTHVFGDPAYSRQYFFPRPLQGLLANPYNLTSDYPRRRNPAAPLAQLGAFVRESMNQEITNAIMRSREVLEVALTKQADESWRRQRPEEFYAELGRCFLLLNPDVSQCTVQRYAAEL